MRLVTSKKLRLAVQSRPSGRRFRRPARSRSASAASRRRRRRARSTASIRQRPQLGRRDDRGRPSRPRRRARRCGSRRTRAASSPSFSERTSVHSVLALGAQALALGAARRPRSARRAPRSAGPSRVRAVDLAGEHDRGGRRAADHRRVRALERDRLELVVEASREDDERAAVVARDHAEHDRPVEVDDRAADLGAVLELQPAHRLGRAVEAGQVGEHDQRPACRSRR